MSEPWPTPLAASALHIGRDAILEVWRRRDERLDPLDALLLTTVIHANVDPVITGIADHVEFGALDAIPPPALRRRTSINRIADSLALPFETVRRRLSRLAAEGLLDIDGAGVLVPSTYFGSPANTAAVLDIDEIAAETYRRLVAIGFFEGRALPTASRRPDEHPYRAVARFFMSCMLRLGGELRALCGDYLDVLLVLNVTQLNTSSVGDGRAPSGRTPGSPILDDALKAPATVAAVSRRSGVTFETTRRRLLRLTDRGVCAAWQGGYIVPAQTFALVAHDLARLNEMNLLRLYRNCALVGAVDDWAEARAAAG